MNLKNNLIQKIKNKLKRKENTTSKKTENSHKPYEEMRIIYGPPSMLQNRPRVEEVPTPEQLKSKNEQTD